jgi:transposase InsO family protein
VGTAAGAKAGYVFLHTTLDGFSRLAYTEALPDEKTVTAIGFMHRARVWFAAHGITHIQRIVTDNGACYRAKDFARVLHGARHQRIAPYTPRHSGKVERYHRILAEEFLYARTWTSEEQRSQALKIWNIHFNYHRPHSAAAGQPPASRLHRCRKRHGLIQLAHPGSGEPPGNGWVWHRRTFRMSKAFGKRLLWHMGRGSNHRLGRYRT